MVMKTSDRVGIWLAVAGLFVTVIGSSSLLAFKIGSVNEKVLTIEKSLEDLPKMKTGITDMQVKLDVLWRLHLSKSTSPLKLSDDELKTLKTSGIDSFVNFHYAEILSSVTALSPDNTRQAQELLISVVNRYKKEDEYRTMLQEASLSSGYDIDSLLFIAAVSIQNRVVSDLGFVD
jgi:hypothetical protein